MAGNEHKIPKRNNWNELFTGNSEIIGNRKNLILEAKTELLGEILGIFKYTGLPDTIPQKDFEMICMCNKSVTVVKDNKGNLYAAAGALGGELNEYYYPKQSIVANPYLKLNKEQFEIDKDCVVVYNDKMRMGMLPYINKYATLIVDSEITLYYALMNARTPNIISAENEAAYESAKKYFEHIWNGEVPGIINSRVIKDISDGVKTFGYYAQGQMSEIIECLQYIKGTWYNKIGLSAAFNMKREAINESEAKINDDILFPKLDNMLKERKEGVERINKMFGTNITVDYDGVWLRNLKEEQLALELQKKEAESDSKGNEEKPEDDKEKKVVEENEN